MKKLSRLKRQKILGFTLIELLVSFSVMAVITGFGLSSFVSISRKQVIYEAVTNLKQAVDQARFSALSVVKPSSCSPTGELTSYIVNICYNSNSWCTAANNRYRVNAICTGSSPVLISTKDMPSNIIFQVPLTGTPCQNITFNSVRAQAIGVPCSVRVSGYGQSIVVSFDSQGYVSF